MEYEFARNSRRCFVSGREIRPGEGFYSVVVDAPTGLERRDYAPEHWTGTPEGAIGYWRGQVPSSTGPVKAKPVDTEMMFALLQQLEGSDELRRRQLRYVLALLLLRRKALQLSDVEKTDAEETLIMRRSRGNKLFRIIDPRLSESEIQDVETELDRLLQSVAESTGVDGPSVDEPSVD